jgi:phage protein D
VTTQEAFTEEQVRQDQVVMKAKVAVAGRPINEKAAAQLARVVVDLHVGLPDMFELTFLDPLWNILEEGGLALGTLVSVEAGVLNEQQPKPLIEAEVTSIEGTYGDLNSSTVVRGSTLEHRLQRVRRTRTFVNAKDSDVARQLAGDAGLQIGTIDATAQVHPQIAQDNQTDWQLLRERAEEIGFEVGVTEGKFFFRRASSVARGAEVPVTSGHNLLKFSPRISSANLVGEVEVRAWDPVNAKAVAVRKPVASSAVSVGAGDAAAAADLFAKKGAPAAAAQSELGPAPSAKAQVVFDRAVTVDSNSTQALTDAASALAERSASGFAEAEGEALGDARIVAGAVLKINGVPKEFEGKWAVGRARHVFDNRPGGGYRTWFSVNGRQDRSLLALTSGGGNNAGPTRIQGVVGAVVTSIEDPLGLARVKVALPWLSPDYETTWAPVAQLTAGKNTGAMFLPEPGDQVLVSFEFGDLRRPYVLGSLVNKRTGAGGMLQPGGTEPGKAAIKAGRPATVARRGFVTPGGNRLVFHDEGPPGGGKPTASQVLLATADDKVAVTLDAVTGELKIVCAPGSPPGRLTIQCDGNVEIKAGSSGTMTLDGGQMLTLKGKTVQVEGTGPVAIKGKPIQLN